jgi:hypothetical protein
MHEIDKDQTGMVRTSLFLNLLQCTDFCINPSVMDYLVSNFSIGDQVFYERIFNMLNYDQVMDHWTLESTEVP